MVTKTSNRMIMDGMTVYKASGGNSAVDNMIAGNPVKVSVGSTCQCENGTIFKRVGNSGGVMSDFESITSTNVADYGVVADATPQPSGAAPVDGTNWSAKINDILLNNIDITIRAPTNGKVIKASNLQLRPKHVIRGSSREIDCIHGDGTGPVWLTNPDTISGGDVRNIEMYNLNSKSDGHPAIDLTLSPDFILQRNTFRAYRSPSVLVDLSVRGNLNYNKIQSSSGALTDIYALKVTEGNGGDYHGNIISGGQGGGAYDIGRTQSLDLSFTTIEVSGLTACRVARSDGNCSSINMKNTYFEQVISAFDLGGSFTLFGADIGLSRIGNTDDNVIGVRAPAVKLGRVQGLEGAGFVATGKNLPDEYLLSFYDVTAGLGPFPFLKNSDLSFSLIEGYIGNWTAQLFPVAGRINSIFGNNKFNFDNEITVGEFELSTSSLIQANSGVSYSVIPPSDGGGEIKSISIVQKSGDATCDLKLGYSLNLAENLSVNPQALTYVNGEAEIATFNKGIRPTQGLLLSTTSGSGSGSFIVKIKYRIGG